MPTSASDKRRLAAIDDLLAPVIDADCRQWLRALLVHGEHINLAERSSATAPPADDRAASMQQKAGKCDS
jgi:hypothetical protein